MRLCESVNREMVRPREYMKRHWLDFETVIAVAAGVTAIYLISVMLLLPIESIVGHCVRGGGDGAGSDGKFAPGRIHSYGWALMVAAFRSSRCRFTSDRSVAMAARPTRRLCQAFSSFGLICVTLYFRPCVS